MNSELYILFVPTALIPAGSPGPAVLLVITRSIENGWKKTIPIMFGNSTGLLILGSASIFGLSVVLKTSPITFTVIKIAGAVYLFYLGIKQLLMKTIQINFNNLFRSSINN